jgi:hypothetical protein
MKKLKSKIKDLQKVIDNSKNEREKKAKNMKKT